ncbi:MAG: GAF domain-containing protein, partial [Spirochaetes bacterium]|nr:GAF domain-containing protein [Spirochaetota bacterium]
MTAAETISRTGAGNLLMQSQGGRLYIEATDELNKAAQYILKAACGLMQAESCFMALRTGQGVKTYRIAKRGLTSLEKNIMQKSLVESETLIIENRQQLFNAAQISMGEAETSYLAAPLMTDGKGVLGALLWATKQGEENFSEEDLSLAATFARTFARMLANCITSPDRTALLVK